MPKIQESGTVLSVNIPKGLAKKKKWRKGTVLNFRVATDDNVILEEAY